MPDTTSRELALQSGEIDAAAGLNEAAWVDRINAEGNLTADVFGAKKTSGNSAALCVFAPLREKISSCTKRSFEMRSATNPPDEMFQSV
jgi:hypothetical protein